MRRRQVRSDGLGLLVHEVLCFLENVWLQIVDLPLVVSPHQLELLFSFILECNLLLRKFTGEELR